jgi:threonyl-tRNA synthetase
MFTTNAFTTKVIVKEATHLWITVVYAPQDGINKIAFLDKLRAMGFVPWTVNDWRGFNLIYRDEDKNNRGIFIVHRRLMGKFSRCIRNLVLKEIYLNG